MPCSGTPSLNRRFRGGRAGLASRRLCPRFERPRRSRRAAFRVRRRPAGNAASRARRGCRRSPPGDSSHVRRSGARSTRRKTSLHFPGLDPALTLRGEPFSVQTAIGFITPFGIAILNGVVLASYLRDLEASGSGVREAATHAAAIPLRPVILMAHLTALSFQLWRSRPAPARRFDGCSPPW
ncbi:efflux RND transporter permease subunit [Methylobacterium sp. A52T]